MGEQGGEQGGEGGARRWVVLLRGVNVNGVTVRSADLRAALEGLGLARVRTVLASGNAVVDDLAGRAPAAVRALVEAGLRERLGHDARVVLAAPPQLAAVVDGWPLAPDGGTHHRYAVFSSDPAVLAGVAEAVVPGADEQLQLAPGGAALWWRCPRGESTTTPVAKALAAARLRPHVTTRGLPTLGKLLAATAG